MQRAYLVALLQALAEARATTDGAADRRLLILALEEPELYQHPLRAATLPACSSSSPRTLAGPRRRSCTPPTRPTSSRSPRSSRSGLRVAAGPQGLPETSISSVDLAAAATELWAAYGGTGGCWTATSLRPRLRPIVETPVSEGFFAHAVVLLEGEEDRAVLAAAAAERDLDLAQRGIALLAVGGKGNLDRAIVSFRQLGIPTYALFDVDQRRGGDGNARSNRALLRLLGRPPEDFPDTQVHASFACFEETLLGTVRGELGAQAVEAALDRACDRFGFTHDGRKNGVVLREAFHCSPGKG